MEMMLEILNQPHPVKAADVLPACPHWSYS